MQERTDVPVIIGTFCAGNLGSDGIPPLTARQDKSNKLLEIKAANYLGQPFERLQKYFIFAAHFQGSGSGSRLISDRKGRMATKLDKIKP
ncbi:MAG: hypothetical protein IAC23_10505 [Bacteroidetes bacterium]|uniref:Uncharacterized protein n=1 Tax=Candidatus Cryptobacteroides merdavium TaxID=2840769 RepID=A0A9D9HDN7_9BACT|nr:hypothetical protein [Candidatus Cryptobacteroides merdavium]